MTKQEAKEFLPLIQALAAGKVIQYKPNPEIDEWVDIDNPGFCFNVDDYRIKPEPMYRPFKDAEECLGEMEKHEHYGYVKYDNTYLCINALYPSGAVINDTRKSYPELLNKITFVDGTPFGIKEG